MFRVPCQGLFCLVHGVLFGVSRRGVVDRVGQIGRLSFNTREFGGNQNAAAVAFRQSLECVSILKQGGAAVGERLDLRGKEVNLRLSGPRGFCCCDRLGLQAD